MRRQVIPELGREREREVDVAERRELRVRSATEDRARRLAEVGERRRLTVDDRLADHVRGRQCAVPPDSRIEVARPGEERTRAGLIRHAERRRAARDEGVAVGDVVEKAARKIGVPVSVHVAVRHRRALRDRLSSANE